MAIQHGSITGDAVHVPYAGTFANAAARTGATGLDSTQHGKLFRQLDDNSLWMLVNTSPLTWKSLSPDKVANASHADKAGYADSAGNAATLNGKAEGNLSVSYAATANYADSAGSAGSAPANGGRATACSGAQHLTSSKLPSGGTWSYIAYVHRGGGGESYYDMVCGTKAGGSNIESGSSITGLAIRRS